MNAQNSEVVERLREALRSTYAGWGFMAPDREQALLDALTTALSPITGGVTREGVARALWLRRSRKPASEWPVAVVQFNERPYTRLSVAEAFADADAILALHREGFGGDLAVADSPSGGAETLRSGCEP